MVYLLGGEIDGKNVLWLQKNGNDYVFQGSEDLEQTKKLLPNLNGYHAASYTWSCSAALWWMSFSPKIYEFESMKEMSEHLLDSKVTRHGRLCGSVVCTELKPDYVPKIAFKTPLIDEGVDTAKPFYEEKK